jgi:hypothetical protein
MAGNDWSKQEVDATVADYFAMWADELRHLPYSKTAHNAELRLLLNGRTSGAVEFKHQNISAVMIELGFQYIAGYKPLGNYQELLRHAVIERLALDPRLEQLAKSSAEAPAIAASPLASWSDIIVEPPELNFATEVNPNVRARVRPTAVDYLELESRNRSLGRAGEEFVIDLERRRLSQQGRSDLADRVEHVAKTQGDGLGYDIASFNEDESQRLIEVKTTRYGQLTPFFVSRNELAVSLKEAPRYHMFRVYNFSADTRVFVLRGALDQIARLEPSTYRATFR